MKPVVAYWNTLVAVLTLYFHRIGQGLAQECSINDPYEQVDCLNEAFRKQQNLIVEGIEDGIYAEHAMEHMYRLRQAFPKPSQVKLDTIQSCRNAPKSGTYLLAFKTAKSPITVQCVATFFGGGWTVFQQRFDGSVDFNQNFQSYRAGFGTVSERTEYWLGLETLHQLTKVGPCELAVELVDSMGEYFYAIYDDFGVADESTQYTMNRLGTQKGQANEALRNNAYGGKFATKDKDAWQTWDNAYFAAHSGGGFWFKTSWTSQLNGWFGSKGGKYDFYWNGVGGNLRYSRLMIRTKS